MVTGHYKNAGIRAGGHFVGHLGFSKFLLGAWAGSRGPPRKGKTFRLRSFPRRSCRGTGSLCFWQRIMPPRGLLPCKNAGILAAHGTPLKCRESGLLPSTGHFGPPSDDLDASKHFFKKAFQLRTFFLAAFWLPSRWPRDTVEMQGIELATLFGAPSAFQQFAKKTLGRS